MKYRAFRYRWDRKIRPRAGLRWDPTPHDLRHYYASFLLSQGIDVVRVASFLGNSTVTQTLDTYAHVIQHDNDDVRALFGRAATLDPFV